MAFEIVKNTFYFLICVASVGSNSLLISILLRFEHLRTTANLFVLNLAFCDLAIVLLSIPFTVAVEQSTSYPFGEFGCKILMPGATAAFNSAAFTLLAIAIERFYAIMFPMRARLQSCKTKTLAIVFLHGASVVSVIPFSIHQQLIKEGDSSKCIEMWPEGGSRIYTLILFFIQYLIPLTVIAALYSISWNQIRKKNKVIIKMQQLQQKGKCHFNRSQSWDVAMKKNDSFSFLLGEASKGNPKRVIQSTSNYSFKSSQLEAVDENNGDESVPWMIGKKGVFVDNDESNETAFQTLEDEQILMKSICKGQHGIGHQVEADSTKENHKETKQNGFAGYNILEKCSTEDAEGGKRGNIPNTDDDGKTVNDNNVESGRFKLYGLLPFAIRCPWIKSDCLPKKLKRSKRSRKQRLQTHIQSISEAHETDLSHPAENEDYSENDHLKSGAIACETPASDAQAKPLAEDAEITVLLQEKNAESRSATARGTLQRENISILAKNTFDRHASTMSHSLSSPALGTTATAHGNTRRQSSQPSLLKGLSQIEARSSRISQIAMQARQKVSQALATSSAENMCSASIKRMKQTRRTLRMFTCVVVVFALCILPNQITWIWLSFSGAHLSHVLYTVFYFLTYTNSVINPWIYGAVNPSFRKAYRKVFRCQTSSKRHRSKQMRTSSKMTYLCSNKEENDASKSQRT